MRKRPVVLVIVMFLAIFGIAVFVFFQQKGPLAKYIEDKTNYRVCDCIDENGEIDIVVEFTTEKEQELYAQYCVRLVLTTIKRFPRQSDNEPEEVTVRLYNTITKQIVLRVSVKGDRLYKTQWETMLEDQIPNNVDYYFFKAAERGSVRIKAQEFRQQIM